MESEEREEPLVAFPPEVQAAIEAVLPSTDPLDQVSPTFRSFLQSESSFELCFIGLALQPDLDVVQHINQLFPSEQSLAGLDDTMADLGCQVSAIEEEMRDMVRSQTAVGGDAAAALEEAQAAIVQLFSQIRDIKNKAGESETMVKEITRDIKQLDTAKRNLTAAITTLNHLHMLVRGTATLTQLAHNRQYGEAALLLQGLLEVLNHFRDYQNIPQITELSEQVETLKRELGDQIVKDFEDAMSGEKPGAAGGSRQLAEACLVVSVLEPRVRRGLISWFLGLQIKEYSIMFSAGEDDAWLDRVDRRYNWLKKHLIEFEERFGPLFPPDWEMSERIAAEFCRVTRTALAQLLAARHNEVDTKLLLHVIQKTVTFESLLSRRFSGATLATSTQYDVASNPFGDNGDEKVSVANYQAINLTPFKGIISQCFEPHLHIYIEAQDRNLADMVERFAADSQGLPAGRGQEGSPVLPSCGDLFVFYRKCLVQCSELSTGQPMLALSSVFR
jgi:archaellum component FlaC